MSCRECFSIVLCLCLLGTAPVKAQPIPSGSGQKLNSIDNDLLDDLSRRSFRYFWDQTNPRTGLVLDRALTIDDEDEDQGPNANVASIAATGFGLTAYCIAADHRWISYEVARERVLTALHFLALEAPEEHGWFYHFLDASTGERRWNSEVSSIDTALLMAGVLTARQYFTRDLEISSLATAIYNRIDFPWMMAGKNFFSHGWTPEKGFLPYRWDRYSEMLILYVLGIGSPTHPVPSNVWGKWKLPIVDKGGYAYVGGGPLFIHQYSQAWLDLRDRGVPEPSSTYYLGLFALPFAAPRVDYFANSVAATRAQQEFFSKQLSREFPSYSKNLWGVTASDSSRGYTDWGGDHARVDGTLVPSASAGSVMFAPDICIPTLRTMLVKYGRKIYGRYGFADAFNPQTRWVSPYAIGIDVGITLLSAENLRTGGVWRWFMSNPEPGYALDLVGLTVTRNSNDLEIQLPTEEPVSGSGASGALGASLR